MRYNKIIAKCFYLIKYVLVFCITISIYNIAEGQNNSSTCPPPPNDICTNAIPIKFGTTCNPATYSSCGATPSLFPSCMGTQDDDVFFSFVPNSNFATITVVSSPGYDAVLQILIGPCGGLMRTVVCVNNTGTGGTEVANVTGLRLGETYYIRVWHFAVGYGTTGNFTVSCYSNTSNSKDNETPPQPGDISGSEEVKEGVYKTYSIRPVSGATSYTWTLPAGWDGKSSSISISAITGSTSGTITVTANNNCGSSSPQTFEVKVKPGDKPKTDVVVDTPKTNTEVNKPVVNNTSIKPQTDTIKRIVVIDTIRRVYIDSIKIVKRTDTIKTVINKTDTQNRYINLDVYQSYLPYSMLSGKQYKTVKYSDDVDLKMLQISYSNLHLMNLKHIGYSIGVSYSQINTKAATDTSVTLIDTINKHATDINGDSYKRIAYGKGFKEKIKIDYLSIATSLIFKFPLKKENSRCMFTIVPGLRFSYILSGYSTPTEGKTSYGGVYPQYNNLDTMFSGLYDYYQNQSSKSKQSLKLNKTFISGYISLNFAVAPFYKVNNFMSKVYVNLGIYGETGLTNILYYDPDIKDISNTLGEYNSLLYRSDNVKINSVGFKVGLSYKF